MRLAADVTWACEGTVIAISRNAASISGIKVFTYLGIVALRYASLDSIMRRAVLTGQGHDVSDV